MNEDTFIPFQPLTALTGLDRDIAAFEAQLLANRRHVSSDLQALAHAMIAHPNGRVTKTGVWLYVVDGGKLC